MARAAAVGGWKDEASFQELLSGLRELEDRRNRLAQPMERLAQEIEHRLAVVVRRCFHGVDTRAAPFMVTEIFAIERFRHPRDLPGTRV